MASISAMNHTNPQPLGHLITIIFAIIFLVAAFQMRSDLEEYYNTAEPINLQLSGVMTFFFAIFYFQHHFSRIAQWKKTGVLSATGLMKRRTITGMAMAAILGGLAVVYRFPPTEYSFYPRCPIYLTTHWLCPGCGSTRALHALLHFDVQSALHYNALFTLLFPVRMPVDWFHLLSDLTV